MQSPAERPVSPHLQVYRPMYTMVLSILHRASGLYLSACSLMFVAWLVAIAAGPAVYDCVSRFFSSIAVRLALTVALAAFWYHLFAGIRHLAWDAGIGFEKAASRRGAALVLLFAAIAFAMTLILSSAGRRLLDLP